MSEKCYQCFINELIKGLQFSLRESILYLFIFQETFPTSGWPLLRGTFGVGETKCSQGKESNLEIK